MRSSRQTGVQVWNRQLGQAVREPVYRGGSLQFLFHNYLGRLLMRHVLPYRFVNNLITWRQRSRISKREIRPFVEYYKIDTSEFKQPIDEFRSFAEFFVRELHPETRPISPGARELVSPCDGRIEWIKEPLGPDTGFVVKGQHFTLSSVLAEPNLAEKFAGT